METANPDPQFVTSRDRDAWAAIRGFVYQVDLTIGRWLKLKDGQILELERGEDIDLVSQSIAVSGGHDERLLEQIKHRVRPISLRSEPAVTALASAVEHRKTNPGLNLNFRFTTNAQITTERVSLIHPSKPGLEIWEEVRKEKLRNDIQQEYLSQIRTILNTVVCPSGLNKDTWQSFYDFTRQSNNEELLDLIHRYEWGTGHAGSEEISVRIQQSLIILGYAETAEIALAKYQRLFLFVFKLLSCSGTKRITVEDLAAQLALPTLGNDDLSVLQTLKRVFGELEKRVTALEEGLDTTNAAMKQIQGAFTALIGHPGIGSTVDFAVAPLILDPPPTVINLCQRVEAVKKLVDEFKHHTWIALEGGAGIGKTQLALLVCRCQKGQKIWLRFRDLSPSQSCARLIKACEIITKGKFNAQRQEWSLIASEFQMEDSVFVLDDIPRLSGSEEFSASLVSLAAACNTANMRLLSTSYWPLPSRLAAVIADKLCVQIQSPILTENDAREILALYGGPKELLNDRFVRFVNGLAGGHPALLTAAAHYLKDRTWRATEETLAVLIKGRHANAIMNETVNHLVKTVEDFDSRELLYRLKLVWGSFEQADVDLLAKIDPPVVRASERLNNLNGLWIQRDVQDFYCVSPLVKALGDDFLSEQTLHDCHDALGARLLNKREIDPNDVWEAFGHYLKAKEFGRAGCVLMIAFNSLRRLKTLLDHRGLLDVWISEPMPNDFQLGMRIYLRAMQVSVRAKFSKRNDYLLRDLDKLVSVATPNEGWAVVATGVLLNATLAKQHPSLINKFLLAALRLNPEFKGPSGETLQLPEGMMPEMLMWTTTSMIQDSKTLRQWLSDVEQLTAQQRQNLFNLRHGPDACVALADRLWNAEAKKPAAEQNWDAVLADIKYLEDWSIKYDINLLSACVTRAEMVVRAERKNDFDSIIGLARPFLDSPDPRVRFLMKEMLGRQYKYAGKNDQSLKWLDSALAEKINAFSLERIDIFLIASFAIGDRNAKRAVQYVESAVEVARACCGASKMLVVALSELAIAKWISGDNFSEIFLIWEEAAQQLLAIRNKKDSWKALYSIFAHCSGYFAHLAETGKAPESTPGGEEYAAPMRNTFFSFQLECAKLYNSKRDILLPAQLALFASGAKNDERSVYWALNSIDDARSRKELQTLPVFGFILIPYLLNANQYSNALDLALEISAILLAAHKHEQDTGRKTLPLGPDILNVSATLGTKPNSLWRQIEYNASSVIAVPTVLRLNAVALGDKTAAFAFAKELQASCLQIAESASDAALWGELANLFGKIYIEPTSGKDLIRIGNQSGNQIFKTVAYLGACIQDDINYATACKIQLAVMPSIQVQMQAPRSAYRQIAAPFISKYWKAAFAKARFEFSTPSMVEQDLSTTYQLEREKQPQAVLRVVANGLGIKLDEQERAWLHGQI